MSDMKAETISAVVDFVNEDLEGLPRHALVEWRAKLIGLLIPDEAWLLGFAGKHNELAAENVLGELLDYQAKWKAALSWLVDHLGEEWQLEIKTTLIFTWGTGDDATFYFGPGYVGMEALHVTAYNVGVVKGKVFWGEDKPEYPKEALTFPAGGQAFLAALDGYRKTSLKTCMECGRIFFNPTKRRRDYCNAVCQNKAGTRRYRERQADKK